LRRWFSSLDHIFGHARLSNIDAELKQLSSGKQPDAGVAFNSSADTPSLCAQLLYPVKQKNYSDDAFIKNEWDLLRAALRDSHYLTIFGYSAPVTDVEARKAMLEDWSGNPALPLNQVEIIDVRPAEDLEATWKDFFVRDHYSFISRLSDSQLNRHPRRSCDAFAAATLMNRPWFDNNVPQFDKLSDLHTWIAPLIEEEDRYARESAQFSGTPLQPNKE
jgi:hypothetical protein